MKKLKNWILILGFAGPVVVNVSCTSAFLRDIRTAAIGSVSSFIGEATNDILGQILNPDDEM